MLKVAMKIEKRSFKNSTGEEIRFQVKTDDKKLFEYLTKDEDLLPEEEA